MHQICTPLSRHGRTNAHGKNSSLNSLAFSFMLLLLSDFLHEKTATPFGLRLKIGSYVFIHTFPPAFLANRASLFYIERFRKQFHVHIVIKHFLYFYAPWPVYYFLKQFTKMRFPRISVHIIQPPGISDLVHFNEFLTILITPLVGNLCNGILQLDFSSGYSSVSEALSCIFLRILPGFAGSGKILYLIPGPMV